MPEGKCTLTIDAVSFALLEAHDFAWLRALGTVFQVFDHQDSGNICFGLQKNGERILVKYAGTRTTDYSGSPGSAVQLLKGAIPIYEDLKHPCLVALKDSFETRDGFAAVFERFDGESLRPHGFPSPALHSDPGSPCYRIRHLTLEKRLDAFDAILRFHSYVEEKGYVAVDFYDGSILYDFSRDLLKICDIDAYEKRPFRNGRGRLWGSTRFMSPEEFVLGASIDERTNVFCMGATAFWLLGGGVDRSIDKWEAPDGLFPIALRAVSPERELRHPSVRELSMAWTRTRTLTKGSREGA